MVANTERLLSTILLGNNLVNVAFSAVVTSLAVKFLGEGAFALAVATIVGTGLLLIFGEIIPKSVAVKKSEKVLNPMLVANFTSGESPTNLHL